VAAAQQLKRDMDQLSASVTGFVRQTVGELIPVLQQITQEMNRGGGSSGALAMAGKALAVVLETITVVGSDVAFVFRGIWREVSTIAAQAGALATGDLERVKQIRAQAMADAQRDRAELDRFQRDVMNARKLADLTEGAAAYDEPRFKRMAASVDTVTTSLRKTEEQAKKTRAAMGGDDWLKNFGTAEDKNRQEMFSRRLEEQEKEEQAHSDWLKGLADAEDAHRWSLYTQRLDEQEKAAQASQDAQMKAAQAAAAEWQKASDKIEDMLTDALMRGFENGKSFGQNLADSIKNIFKTYVAQAIAKAITGAIMAALAQTAWVWPPPACSAWRSWPAGWASERRRRTSPGSTTQSRSTARRTRPTNWPRQMR
jgi:hypothetical protein